MKVRELIERLQEFDGDLPVVLPGYEDGVNDVDAVKQVEIALNVNPDSWVYGAHEEIVTEYEIRRYKGGRYEVTLAVRLTGENHLAQERSE